MRKKRDEKSIAESKNKNIASDKNNEEHKKAARSGRGRPPKPIDLEAALELTLIGSSLREQARQAGCSARTLMGRYAKIIELAEARLSGLLKMHLYHLALIEGNPQALLFLLRHLYEGQGGKWSRRQLRQAVRIVWRHAVAKPNKRNYTPFRLKGRKTPPPRNWRPEAELFHRGAQ